MSVACLCLFLLWLCLLVLKIYTKFDGNVQQRSRKPPYSGVCAHHMRGLCFGYIVFCSAALAEVFMLYEGSLHVLVGTHVFLCVCVGSMAPLMCWAHMAGRLHGPGTVHNVVIWQRTHRCLCYPLVSITLLHGWCGTTHVELVLLGFAQMCSTAVFSCVCVCMCVWEVTNRPVCGSVSCQESVCPRSGHMDIETADGQSGSGSPASPSPPGPQQMPQRCRQRKP